MAPGARLRGDVFSQNRLPNDRPASFWGYVVTVDEDGCGKWTSRDQSSISGLCPGRFELSRGHGPGKPGSARTSFGLRSSFPFAKVTL